MKRLIFTLGFIISFVAVFAQQYSLMFEIQFVDTNGQINSVYPGNLSYSFDNGTVYNNSGTFHYYGKKFSDTALVSSSAAGTLTIHYDDCDSSTISKTFTGVIPNTTYTNYIVYCDPNNVGVTCNADFSYNVSQNNVSFNALAVYNQIHDWDFGDGSYSSQEDPVHTYSSPGTYYVTHYASNSQTCTTSVVDTVIIDPGPGCDTSFILLDSSSIVYGFASTVSPYLNYTWTLSTGDTLNGANFQFDFQTSGTYQVCLTVSDIYGTCTQTSCQNITVSLVCDASFSYSGQNGISFYTSGSGYYPNHTWYFGDGYTSTATYPTHYYSQAGTYTVCHVVENSSGTCSDSVCQTITAPQGSRQVKVGFYNLNVDTTIVTQTRLYLIEHDTSAGTLTAIDSADVYITNYGESYFYNVPNGVYLAKAAVLPGQTYYDSILPTYADSTLFWSSAHQIVITSGSSSSTFSSTGYLIHGTNPGGPGFVGGLISQGANKTGAVGDPVPNLNVLILDENMEPVTAVQTNSNGEFSYDNLAIGSYYIYPEKEGKITTPIEIEITNETTDIININFDANSTTIVPSEGTGIEEYLQATISVYPNPVKDQLNISNTSDSKIESVTISAINGQIVYSSPNVILSGNAESLDVSNYQSGMYIIEIKTTDDTIMKKFIK